VRDQGLSTLIGVSLAPFSHSLTLAAERKQSIMTEQAQDKQQQNTTAQPGTEQQGVQGWLKIVIAVIFYSGLTVFLLSSIDHVA
jgi:hypothetical protein